MKTVESANKQKEHDVVTLSSEILPKVNFASAQNDVSIIKRLAIVNPTDSLLKGVRLTLRSTPAIIRDQIWYIDQISAKSEFSIRDVSTKLDLEKLAGLNEAEVGELQFHIDADDRESVVEIRRIEFLARDEWGGLGDMAQILAAFVSPNDLPVAKLLKSAARLLEAAGHDGAIDGYQSGDPRRVYMLAGAIWSAATGLGLTYAEPPASFELQGQKIRGPERIEREGLATCLDLTLFLGAAFEAAGLNSVVMFSEGHSWVGVWLQNSDFGHVTEPDIIAIRKALQAREFVSLESTLLTKRPSIGFEYALDMGARRLSEDREVEFLMAIDVARSRAAGIRPLASQVDWKPTEDETQIGVGPAVLPPLPDFGLLPSEMVDDDPKTSQGRIEIWQKKLLDLTLRNRLLNFRDSKQTLPLLCTDVAALEDRLADGKNYRGISLTDENPVGKRGTSLEIRQQLEEEFTRDAFEREQIAVPFSAKEMNNRFLQLYRRAKSDISEGGTNTLFLAVGFLRWKKSESDQRTFRAPVLLIPVKLERRSALSNFKISHHEDGVRINSTLLELLKRDFKIEISALEGELPQDESGVNVPLIFEHVRLKIRDVPGFEVVEELALSTFSFAKYLLWKDLVDRSDQLRENRLVKHLIDGTDQVYDNYNSAPVSPEEIDRRFAPRDLMTPLAADSSQLAAVIAASEGRDFVLIGPPGTGKSQTIANMISQCLGEDKKVLFVAEKAAALDVVHRRLVACGLGDAVLELHSNKSDRKSVVAQLGRSWDRASNSTEQQWLEVTENLRVSRDQLNTYVEALHAKGTQGFSVFEAIGCVARGKANFALSFASKDAHDKESYKRLLSLVNEIDRIYAVVADRPPISLIDAEEWSYRWEDQILEVTTSFRNSLSTLKRVEQALARELGLSLDADLTLERRTKLLALAQRLDHDAVDLADIPEMSKEHLTIVTQDFSSNWRAYMDAKSETVAEYSLDSIRRMPLEQLDADWRIAQTRSWPFSIPARNKVHKLFQTYVDQGTADPAIDLNILFKLRKLDAKLQESPLASTSNSGEWSDADRTIAKAQQAIEFRKSVDTLRADVEDVVHFNSATQELASTASGPVRDLLNAYLEAEAETVKFQREFLSNGGKDFNYTCVSELEAGLSNVLSEREHLADWTRWVKLSNKAAASGLTPLIKALESDEIVGSVEKAFRNAYASWWLPLAMDASDVLRKFAFWEHDNLVKTFRKLDEKAAELTPNEVIRRIAHGLPVRDSVPRNTELGILRHQLGLVRPSMPIRTLVTNLPETFGKLAPCVLMSPLSVAQYLPAGQAVFDVVIFDEASQIQTWDAIGAIARANQTIIVGDPKQLPPTNFFGRVDDEDEEILAFERDMPSILDEVASAGVQTRRLDWHYRSRDEALIAFSNHYYYDDRLVTFPAPTTGSNALHFHKVDGTYARGTQGRINQVEAKAVAELVKRYLTEWIKLPEGKRLTLGVITFNQQQQSLILDLLDECRRADSRLEWFFDDEREEPVIVKNLENIQGDERDVMMFSITFGPDLAGKLSMNFGALNQKGGEKRLNVAVTRSRLELHVFASIQAEQIDLSRTRATGVSHLKAFLDYAARGQVALPALDEGSLGLADSPFEEAVADAICLKGWEVRNQIGVTGFRVDLGVVHPDFAGSYLAGIECDGATYHSTATARDRDKVRQAVLEGLGWAIIRIWSTDWFRSPHTVTERVNKKLDNLLELDRSKRKKEEAKSETQFTESEDDDNDAGSYEKFAQQDSALESEQKNNFENNDSDPLTKPDNGTINSGDASIQDKKGVPNRDFVVDSSRFYDDDYLPNLRRLIWSIVEKDGPLPLDLLARKVTRLHGWKRAGARIKRRVQENLGSLERHSEFSTTFIWLPETYTNRVQFRGLAGRNLQEVSRTEIASVINSNMQKFENEGDQILALARLLGIKRLSKANRTYLSKCKQWNSSEVDRRSNEI